MFTSATFSPSARISSASSIPSSWALNSEAQIASPEQLKQIQQALEVMRQSAAQGTKPPRRLLYDGTADWPLNRVWEAVFTFDPKKVTSPDEGEKKQENWIVERSRDFEHMLDEETGKVTKYSKWYFEWAVQRWEEPMRIDMKWNENMFKKSWHSRHWLENRRQMREKEEVGPMGEKL